MKTVSKKTTKKVTKKVAKKVVKKPTYKLEVSFNDTVHKIKTDNLEESIASIKPFFLKTKVLIRVSKGSESFERVLFVRPAKRMWATSLGLRTFVNNLIFKKNG
jgi:hypothetical protein